MPAGTSESSSGSGSERELGEPVTAARPVHPYVHVVIVAVIGAVAVLAWLIVFDVVNRLLWENEFVTANRWMFPAICLPFSLLVGLLVKYRHAPTTLDESLLDSLAGDVTKIDWRTLPINVLMAWASLFSGAVLGPEGGIGGIASKIAVLYGEKVGIPVEHRSRLVFSTLASAYNGLVASPLFTAVLGTELVGNPEARSRNLPANLIGGAFGYMVFFAAGNTGLQDYLNLPPARSYALVDIFFVVIFGLVGLVLALISGAMFRVAAALFGRLEGREVERALAAGVVFSAVGIFAPILLFSGESQVKTVSADPAAYGAAILVAMALVKLALLAVAFKSGFLGGPTFPAIFASVCVALAISQLAPGIPVDVIIGGIMGGFLLVLFKAPLMVILLTTVMLQADLELIALILLAVAAVMVVLPYVMTAMARRPTASRAAPGSTA
jgi:H+/Cl- antiporter ClcA